MAWVFERGHWVPIFPAAQSLDWEETQDALRRVDHHTYNCCLCNSVEYGDEDAATSAPPLFRNGLEVEGGDVVGRFVGSRSLPPSFP